MIWTIAKKELLEHFYSLKFRVVAVLCVGAIIASNLILLQDYQRRMEDYSLNLPKEGQARVVMKPSVLSVYANGLQKLMGRGYDLRPGSLLMFPSASILNLDFISSRFAVPDMAYLVRVLISFLAMLIAFDTFSGEKEQGTLRLFLSNSIPRTEVVVGKIVGNLLIILAPFTFSFCLGLLLILLFGGTSISTEEFARIAIFYIGSILYVAIFIMLAAAVSSRTRTSNTSLVACFFAWAILVFGIPNLSGTIARAISPLPSSQSLEEEKLLTCYIEGNYRQARGETSWDEIYDRLRHLEHEYRNQLNSYVETTRKVSRLSPASSFIYFASTIAQSGFEDEQRLKQAVLEYRDALQRSPVKVGEIHFLYQPLAFTESLQLILLDLLVLFLFLALFFAVSYTSFLRYDAR
ncbi:MAG: ABC transporter permease [candidate division KSB1 bacterium]|nr:ABC transporter permease [candidate division KSB1 bacterium]MDZ7305132.1 ABC transporter permease [candidate division KSB1 bacterium]MDZ7311738.1 ABC transporter permease [candidate division KSB1 bacterium]